MRISDWSSDVCSSDLLVGLVQHRDELADLGGEVGQDGGADRLDLAAVGLAAQAKLQIGEGLREAASRIGDALRILVVDSAREGLHQQQQQHDILLRLAGPARAIHRVPDQNSIEWGKSMAISVNAGCCMSQ